MRETVWFSQHKHTPTEACFVVLSFLGSFYLLFLPCYSLVDVVSPAWPLMVLFYWRKHWPQFASLWVFWCIGLLLDLLSSPIIGAQALALVVVYGVMSLIGGAKLTSQNLYSQALWVFLLVFIFQWVCLIVLWGAGSLHFSILYFTQTLLSAFLWPWFAMFLGWVHRFFRRGG